MLGLGYDPSSILDYSIYCIYCKECGLHPLLYHKCSGDLSVVIGSFFFLDHTRRLFFNLDA